MKTTIRSLVILMILAVIALQSGCDGDPELVEPAGTDTTTVGGPTPVASIEDLKMNQLQAIGSHNSYRLKTYEPLLTYLKTLGNIGGNDPEELDYTHETLVTQFDSFNIRSIELDIYNDPSGGAYYDRQGNTLILEPTASNEPELQNPGMKLIHIIDIDYNTHHFTFVGALIAVRDWSNANPNHLPLIVMVECKEDGIPLPFFTNPIPHDASSFDAMDAEVASVFGSGLSQVVTPDDFRGGYGTVNEAALAGAWPTLEFSRGTIYFVLMLSAQQKTDYLSGHAGLAGRTMFVFGEPGEDITAFTKFDDPASNQDTIQSLVQLGYMVRTRTDAGTWQARSPADYTRMDAALSSGAQIVSTDYYRADERAGIDPVWSDFSVQLPGGVVARLNPINGPSEYTGLLIDE